MEMIAQEGIQEGGFRADSAAGLVTGLAALVDELAHGAVVMTLEGRLLHANYAGTHEMARARTLTVQQGLVQACDAESERSLHVAVLRAADGKRGLVQLQAADGPALPVAVLPLNSRSGEPACVALLFARSTVCDSLMLGFFARSHALTPAEEQVLGILSEGCSAPQIARQLEVAVSTVRTHVRSICAKTRCTSVRELVSRVAVLPPVAPAHRQEPVH
jgi:DNA-binding CsgD family transcriptional regulator